MHQGICDYCNQPFEAKREARFCSDEHKSKWHQMDKKRVDRERFRLFARASGLTCQEMRTVIEEELG